MKSTQEEWEAIEYEDWRGGTYYIQDKKTKFDICSVDHGWTIGEQMDMACRIARLPEVERERDEARRLAELFRDRLSCEYSDMKVTGLNLPWEGKP